MGRTIYAAIATAIAIMAMPAVAQAVQLQVGGSELANGSTVRWQSSNLKAQINNEAETDLGTATCTGNEFEGSVTANQGAPVESTVAKTALTGCKAFGLTTDVATNASSEKPWKLQIDQPEEGGQFTAHLQPASGGTIQFSVQPQVFGFSITTCDYTASSIQLMGEEGSSVLHVEGSNQLTKQSGSGECGSHASLQGESKLESGGTGVTVDGEFYELCETAEMPCPEGEAIENNAIVTGSLEAGKSMELVFKTFKVTCGTSNIEQVYPDAKGVVPALGDFTKLESPVFCKESVNNKNCTFTAENLPWQIELSPAGGGSGSLKVAKKGKGGEPLLKVGCEGMVVCEFKEAALKMGLVFINNKTPSKIVATNVPFTFVAGPCGNTLQVSATWVLSGALAID